MFARSSHLSIYAFTYVRTTSKSQRTVCTTNARELLLKKALEMVSRSKCEKPLTSIDLLVFRPSETRWDRAGSSIHFEPFCPFFPDARSSTMHTRRGIAGRKHRQGKHVRRACVNTWEWSIYWEIQQFRTATLKPYLVCRSAHSTHIRESCPYQ